ncbi:PREDICTED: CRIB domain-containing protein RIC1 [Camelina sativa]|uniref:CRIB domain-containing protein RIC1 n=1 Tax=Camelina sativa TaxID=90675 RepID=A0ABM0SNL1_CAMSA|nr:PREDICTED: CRIB domain-containing protein RIC1 [Camelina sativa]
MATTMKGLLKGLRYITQIFDEEKEQEMQIGFPTDVKHVAHIGSDGPATNTPSWMNDFKPQEHEKGQVVSRGNSNKYNPQGMNQGGVGLKELLPSSTNEKPKHKTRRKPGGGASPNPNGSPPRKSSGNAASSDESSKHSRHHRSKHGSMDSSNDQEPSVRRRRGGIPVPDTEASNHHPIPDGSAPPRKATSRPRKLKGSAGGEASMKKSSKGKPENSVDTCNDIV